MQAGEKRRSQRTVFRQLMEFEVCASLHEDDCLERKALGIDINSDGVGLEAEYELSTGELVKLLFPLGKGVANIPVFAEVRWVEAVGQSYRMGLHFLA